MGRIECIIKQHCITSLSYLFNCPCKIDKYWILIRSIIFEIVRCSFLLCRFLLKVSQLIWTLESLFHHSFKREIEIVPPKQKQKTIESDIEIGNWLNLNCYCAVISAIVQISGSNVCLDLNHRNENVIARFAIDVGTWWIHKESSLRQGGAIPPFSTFSVWNESLGRIFENP